MPTPPDYRGRGEIVESRRRGRQNFLILRRILFLTETCWDEQQVVAHFVAGENLAELGHEHTRLEVTRQLLQAADVLDRGFTNCITEGPLLPRLFEAGVDDLVDGLSPLRIFEVGLGEAFIDVGHL